MPPLAAMLAIAAVAGLGDTQVAAWGLASRLETLSLMVILAMTMSLPPWLGRCYGAGDWEQIHRLMRLALTVAVAWQLALGVLLALASPWVAMALAGNPEVQSELALLMRRMAADLEGAREAIEKGGTPEIVTRALIAPPASRVGPITPDERKGVMATSPVLGKYDTPIDRESAFEVLNKRAGGGAWRPGGGRARACTALRRYGSKR